MLSIFGWSKKTLKIPMLTGKKGYLTSSLKCRADIHQALLSQFSLQVVLSIGKVIVKGQDVRVLNQ